MLAHTEMGQLKANKPDLLSYWMAEINILFLYWWDVSEWVIVHSSVKHALFCPRVFTDKSTKGDLEKHYSEASCTYFVKGGDSDCPDI